MSKSVSDLVAEARAEVPAISPEEAAAIKDRDDVLIVDVRDDAEVAATGRIEGAVHVSRGMLEFRADETSPARDKAFARDKTVLVYCGSGARAALAGRTLKELGYTDVRNLGGFKDWLEAGGAVEKP